MCNENRCVAEQIILKFCMYDKRERLNFMQIYEDLTLS
jgi:hypothetical protein